MTIPTTPQITFPTEGATVSGIITVEWSASTLPDVIAPEPIASTAQVFEPTVEQGVAANTIVPGFIASTAQVFEPTVSEGGGDVFTTDFSEYSTGALPSDWTVQWDALGSASEVRDDVTHGRVLQIDGTSPFRAALTWDIIPSSDEKDVIVRVRPVTGGDPDYRVNMCVAGDGSSETGYAVGRSASGNNLQLGRYNGGSFSSMATGPELADHSGWVLLRVQKTGSTVRIKAWADGDAEPGTWGASTTDGSPLSAGATGIGRSADGGTTPYLCNHFSAALDGATPVTPDPMV